MMRNIFEIIKNLFYKDVSVDEPASDTNYFNDIIQLIPCNMDDLDLSGTEIKVCVITDEHGCLRKNTPDLELELINNVPDFIFLLGDNYYNDLEYLVDIYVRNKETFKNTYLLGLVGNHDNKNLLDNFPEIIKMDGISKDFTINGKTFCIGGLSGSIKYKDNNIDCLRTHKDSEMLLKTVYSADILITHDKPCFEKPSEEEYEGLCTNAHMGLYGIGKYILENRPKYIIHGHLHNRDTKQIIYSDSDKRSVLRCCYKTEYFSLYL